MQTREPPKQEIIESAVGDIHVPQANSKIPIDMNFEFIPQNPYTLKTESTSEGLSTLFPGLEIKSGAIETAREEFKDWNFTYQGMHAKYEKDFEQPLPFMDIPPPDWNPNNPDMLTNVQPQYFKYMLEATGPKDQQYRLQRVMDEQRHDEILANGGMVSKLLGGLAGVVTDPISYIPIVGWAKYAKFAPTIFKSATRALPGVATASVLQNAANQADKVNGNMVDFLTNSFVETVFGTTLFAGFGALSLTADKLELWKLNKFAKSYIDGAEFSHEIDEAGKVVGFKASPPRDGSLSAAQVSFANDLADSSFAKSGVFKIPYLGEATLKFLSMPVLGTPLPALLTSPFNTIRGVVDRVADHTIKTKGMQEGKAAPVKFETLMRQQFSSMRAMSAQIDALHLERNGLDIKSRPLGGLANLGLGLKNKTLEVLGQDIDKVGYVGKEQFYSEIENVLLNETPSEHAPVNAAATMLREKIDTTYKSFREAYDLPETWMPPKTAAGYLMRVYDTPYLNANEGRWIEAIGGWLKEADAEIAGHMRPIEDVKAQIKTAQESHDALIKSGKATDEEVTFSARELEALQRKSKKLENDLSNRMRTDESMHIHVDDHKAFSADESKQLKTILKPLEDKKALVEAKQKEIESARKQALFDTGKARKSRKAEKATEKMKSAEQAKAQLESLQEELANLKGDVQNEEFRLQDSISNGEVNPAFYERIPGSNQFKFKDPENRLKFRDTYESDFHREQAAKAYYDTIMNQTAEQTIGQVMGRLTGNMSENHIKQRTLLIPDEVLYRNNFMSKDLMAKVNNYVNYLSRRTYAKTIFNDVTIDGGFKPLVEELTKEYERFRSPMNQTKQAIEAKIDELKSKLAKQEISQTEFNAQNKKLEAQAKKVDKDLAKKAKEFDTAKEQMNTIYEKMMGIRNISHRAQKAQKAIMSLTAMANLPFVPFTMINDLSAAGLQHGIWPYLRDGVAPIIESLGGMLKTKNSEALREAAPHIHLGMQDVLNGFADRNWSMHTEPYTNMGKIVDGVQNLAHFSSNFTLTNYFDNALQHVASAVSQSVLMDYLHQYLKGTLSKNKLQYLLKYGIDPAKWAQRMTDAFKKNGGGKSSLGGYQSRFWHWEDLEASNEFGRAVYRATQDTTIQRGMFDSPMWADPNSALGIMGGIIHGFLGWTYASVNRYVIPSLQQPDAKMLLGVMFMLGTGSLVSPMRRMARGDDPIPQGMTDKQRLWETIQDSGYFSFFTTFMADANVLTGDSLMGDLRNDRYKDRTRAGLLGPTWGTFNRMADVVSALGSGEWNEADAKKAARMMPIANSSWTYWMSKKLIESLGLPKTRAAAKALKKYS